MENTKPTQTPDHGAAADTALSKAKIAISQEHPEITMPLKFDVTPPEKVKELLDVTDLTSVETTPKHIIKIIFDNIMAGLASAQFPNVTVFRGSPIVSADDNFNSLLFTPGNPGRSSTYTRYVDPDHVLRTHTSSLVPQAFRELKARLDAGETFQPTSYVFPGLVYRRDVIDPRHLDVFHQIDLWTLVKNSDQGRPADRGDLLKLVEAVFKAACPTAQMKVLEAIHPYTVNGIEVYAVTSDGGEFEVLEAGLIHPEVLKISGLDPNEYSGLALGMGVERLIMARKKLPDIRLIRSTDPRTVAQMSDLEVYKPVSSMPPMKRDMSFCVGEAEREEDICEEIKEAFGAAKDMIEHVELMNRIAFKDLEPIAKERLGATDGQDNVLVRIILRHPDKTLTKAEGTELYKQAYRKLHKGTNWVYAL